ncbi:MAG TPA: ABC transporter substrate-binding protein [Candidatus Binatia bacterium]|jgi:NitT/TauT family transport system substrate-binding protein
MKNVICQLRLLIVVIAALVVVVVDSQAQTTEKIRIAYASNSLAFLVPFVARDRGFYTKNGIETELIQVRPNVAMAALLSGDIDYVELIGSIIRSAAKGAPVRAISTSIKAPFFSFVANSKFKTIKDLKGATIGVTAIGGTNYVSTRLTLRHYGLDPDKDVKILAIGDEKVMYDAFKIGRVDSIVVAPPFSVILKREGFPLLANTGELLNFPFSGVGTTLDKIGKNRAQARKLLRGEIEALRFVRANPAGTTEVVRKRFNMDEKMARESYEVVVDAFSRDGRVPLEGVEILLDIEKAAKQIPQNITADMVVDNTLVDETLKELGR